MFKRLRERLTGRYESAPFRLMSAEEARQWVYDNNPVCRECKQMINPDTDNFFLTNSSTEGISVSHYHGA